MFANPVFITPGIFVFIVNTKLDTLLAAKFSKMTANIIKFSATSCFRRLVSTWTPARKSIF